MNIEILNFLNSFDESTLKQMVIDLIKQNEKSKDNKKLESQIKQLESEKNKLQTENTNLQTKYDLLMYREQHRLTFYEKYIKQWIDQNLVEADNITGKDGIERAPTDFDTLYDDYVQWCQEEGLCMRADKKKVKADIKQWQEKSKYGLSYATKKSDSEGMPNGYEKAMKFNLKIL